MNKNKINWQTKPKQDIENRIVVIRGEEAVGRVDWVKGINCMVTDGSSTSGGEYAVVFTEVEI